MFAAPTRTTLAALLIAAATGAGAGCQEQVVHERYVPHTGMGPGTPFNPESPHGRPPKLTHHPARQRSEPGLWDSIGEALFGWTEIFSGDSGRSGRSGHRASRPRTNTSPGSMRPVSPGEGAAPRSPAPDGSSQSTTSSPGPLWRGYGDRE
jgi:hypothetical protein